jgi:hypothetical protein
MHVNGVYKKGKSGLKHFFSFVLHLVDLWPAAAI